MSYSAVSVTTSPTLILSANSNRLSLIIVNSDASATLYIGDDSSVSISNGIPISAGSNLTEDSGGTKIWMGPVYGVSSTGTISVRVWERTR